LRRAIHNSPAIPFDRLPGRAAQRIHVGRQRMARLMRPARAKGASRRTFVVTTTRDWRAQRPPIKETRGGRRPSDSRGPQSRQNDGPAGGPLWADPPSGPATASSRRGGGSMGRQTDSRSHPTTLGQFHVLP
jgi:hypothetical protein